MPVRLTPLNVLLVTVLLNAIALSGAAADQSMVGRCSSDALMTVALDFTASSSVPASIASVATAEARDLWAGSGLLIESALDPRQSTNCVDVLRVVGRAAYGRQPWLHVLAEIHFGADGRP